MVEITVSMQSHNMDEEENSQINQWYGVREATLFVVDTTRKMFEKDPETKLSYIHKFFKVSLYRLYFFVQTLDTL